jgi:hypothetical protein
MKLKCYAYFSVFISFCILNLNCIAQTYNSTSLPIIWGNLTSKRLNLTTNLIEWKTIAETNSSRYNVQRSSDGIYFSTIGEVAGKGNVSSSADYSFEDKQAFGAVYYYRIQQLEYNNKINYSIVIKNGLGGKKTLVGRWGSNALLVYTFSKGNKQFRITDLSGNMIKQFSSSAEQQIIDLNFFSTGVYTLQVICAEGSKEVFRFVK